jgi:hypothetical protein
MIFDLYGIYQRGPGGPVYMPYGQMMPIIWTSWISITRSQLKPKKAPILLCSSRISELGECVLIVFGKDNKEEVHR